MSRTLILVLACLVGLTLMLSACDKRESGKSGERQIAGSIVGPKVQNDSPREVVESFHKLAMEGDFRGMVELFEPAQQEAAAVLMGATHKVLAARKVFYRLVEQELGAEQAQFVGSDDEGSSPFSSAANQDGSLDWSKIQINENGNTVTVEVDGRIYRDRIVRIDGKWYFNSGDGRSPDEMMEEAQKTRDQAARMIGVMDDLGARIKAGEVTAGNFRNEYISELLKAR